MDLVLVLDYNHGYYMVRIYHDTKWRITWTH